MITLCKTVSVSKSGTPERANVRTPLTDSLFHMEEKQMASHRITRTFLQSREDRLNKTLNRPATAWTRNESAKPGEPNLVGNVGHFMLDVWAPGDGWTRYKLTVILSVGGGESNVSQNCTAQEMSVYLQGIFDVLDSYDYTHQFDKYPEAGKVGA
jgi:hypothetical protein